ncbi:MAG TPA: carboxypeptidase-like regulatory domain-containing protein, partial [Verrucomicrobiae bacterium]
LYPLALPSDLADGLYILKATYYAHSTGQRVGLTRIVAVDGLEALLVAATDEPVYHSGDPITATAWLTNTGDYAIVGGRLALKAISMLGVGPLAGVVQDDDAQRIPGARVTLDDATTAWTNLAGEFRFESVGVGQHTFQVERVGYLTYTGTHFVVGPQAPLTFTLTPRPVAELSGAVRVSGGVTIVVGADVRLVPSAPSPALGQSHRRTGADGTYVFTDLTPGDYTLTVTAPGFATYTATLTLNAGTNSHDVELTPYSAWRLPFAVPRLARLLFQNQKPTIHNPQSKVPGLASPVRIPLLTNVGGAIITDTTWTLAGSPYVLTSDTIITAGVTLTVEPGVIVKGNSNVELKVMGHLVAVGTAGQPITFTSATNTSGGQWSGLVFDGGTGHLRHVTVRYGGQDNTVQGNNTGSNIVARNIISGELRLEQSSLRNVYNYYTDFGLYVANSRVVVSDTLFASNGNATGDYAFFSTGGSVITLAGSAFQNNAGWAARVEADDAQQVSDCTFSGNGYNRVLVGSGTFVNGITLVPQSGLQAYEFENDMTVAAGRTLTIAPDTLTLWRSGVELKVLGHLTAVGTPAQPITFTSATNTSGGQWSGLVFDGGTGHLRHVTVRYGGQDNTVQGNNTGSNIVARNITSGTLRLEQSSLRNVYNYL